MYTEQQVRFDYKQIIEAAGEIAYQKALKEKNPVGNYVNPDLAQGSIVFAQTKADHEAGLSPDTHRIGVYELDYSHPTLIWLDRIDSGQSLAKELHSVEVGDFIERGISGEFFYKVAYVPDTTEEGATYLRRVI